MDVECDGNLYALVISGKPTDEQLLQAWENIQIEYADAIGDNDTRMIMSLEKELNSLIITNEQIQKCIDVLRSYYVEFFHKELNRLLAANLRFDVRLKEDYENDLKRAIRRSKGIMISIELKRRALESIKKEKATTSTNKKVTRAYFQGILITLSDFAQYEIRDNITVYMFCERIRRLNQYMEQKKLTESGKRK